MSSKKKLKKQETEELVRTQVLNIDEVRKVEKYEKKYSRKPAGICALLGIIMILIGGGTQGYITYQEHLLLDASLGQDDVVERETTESKQQTIISGPADLVCILSMQGNANGTNYYSTFVYSFEDSKLKRVKKDMILDAIANNPDGYISMTNLYNTYKTYAPVNGTINGYSLTIGPRGEIGFYSTVQADLTLLNQSLIPANIQDNIQVNIKHPLDTDIDTVKEDLESQGFVCNINSSQQLQ